MKQAYRPRSKGLFRLLAKHLSLTPRAKIILSRKTCGFELGSWTTKRQLLKKDVIAMKYYLLKNRSMPWGDYGDMLFSGLLKVLDEHYDDLEIPEIQRAGPYFPDIYMANTCNIIVTDREKTLLESSDISGISGYRRAIVKKMVDIDWQSWNLDSEDPLFYPKGKSSINYI